MQQFRTGDRITDGRKPALVEAVGARYHGSPLRDSDLAADIMIECTGVPAVVVGMLDRSGPAAVTCLMGMTPGTAVTPLDVAAWSRCLVRQNGVVFGSVNANRRHYQAAAEALAVADPQGLAALITRGVPLERYAEAFRRLTGDVKVVIDFAA